MRTIPLLLRMVLGVQLTVVLAACGTPPKAAADPDSVIELVRSQRFADSPGAQDALRKAFELMGDVEKSPSYMEYLRGWCVSAGNSVPAGQTSLAHMNKGLAEICTRKGGVFRDGFCRGAGEPEPVFFMALVEPHTLCRDKESVSAKVVVPTVSPIDPSYIERLRKSGYLSEAEQGRRRSLDASQRLAENLGRQAQAAREAARIEQELPLMKVRGAQICLQRNGVTYVSQVDDVSGDRLRVLNVNAYMTGSPGWKPGGWQPGTAWIDPHEGWYLCR